MTMGFDLARTTERLSIEASREADGITVRLVGEADMEAMPVMTSALKQLHDEMLRSRADTAIMDLTRLDFMNSSCFKTFVSWIDRVQAAAPDSYRIRFISNSALLWQRRSLHALKCFADDLISIDT